MRLAQYRRLGVHVGDIPTQRRAGVAIGHGRKVGAEKAAIKHDELHALALWPDYAAFIHAGAGLYFVRSAPIGFIGFLRPFLERKSAASVIGAIIMIVPCRHHRHAATETVELDAAVQLSIACGQGRDIRAVCRPYVAIDIVTDQQKRLWLLRGNHVPEFHIAVFVHATAKGEARDDRIRRQSGVGGRLGQIGVQGRVIRPKRLLRALRGNWGHIGRRCDVHGAAGEQ